MSLPNNRGPWNRAGFVGLVVVLVIGLSIGFLFVRGESPRRSATIPNAPDVELPNTLPTTSGTPDAVKRDGPSGAAVRVATPDARTAIATFLEAEAGRDFARSYAVLTDVDRRELGPASAWRNLHADIPTITGFEIEALREHGGGQVEAVARLELESVLSEVIGLVPARALSRWRVVRQSDGWRVSFRESVVEPLYPPAAEAEQAAARWAASRLSCDSPSSPFEDRLFGDTGRAEELCGSGGAVTTGGVERLVDDVEVTALVNAYGDEAYDWARVVPLRSPVAMRLVLAPIDDQWVVIGVLRAMSQGGRSMAP